ncbi:hypothetical protein V8C44DRAFT_323512, partial [Trichoderma aethiopicum]
MPEPEFGDAPDSSSITREREREPPLGFAIRTTSAPYMSVYQQPRRPDIGDFAWLIVTQPLSCARPRGNWLGRESDAHESTRAYTGSAATLHLCFPLILVITCATPKEPS